MNQESNKQASGRIKRKA